MTLDHWLDQRELTPPAALRQRLAAAVADAPKSTMLPVPDAALAAALRLLDSLLRTADSSRAGALELLTADALMTYAFEATADTPERLEALGAEAMERIAAAAADHAA
jgi:hypothetical protein